MLITKLIATSRNRMAPDIQIAIVQLYPVPLEAETNFNKAKSFIESAASQGADLVVLPEYHLTGWAPHEPSFKVVCSDSYRFLEQYCVLARTLNICIVPGTIIKKISNEETRAEEFHNFAYFIDRNGDIVGEYVKRNLW